MLEQVTVRFYADLDTLAWDADRDGIVEVPFGESRSVKDLIESCGVPHTEVDLVLVNGASVAFDHPITAGDRVSVYPPFASLDVAAVSRVRPEPLDDPRFVCDVHLGRLAERLRLLGFDVRYRNDYRDEELAGVSVRERRWLLTRDRGLLMRRAVTHGYYVRSTDPAEQTMEVLRRLELFAAVAPFTRCIRCSGLLRGVAKEAVADDLQPGTRAAHDDFARCSACGQVYWPGSHRGPLERFVADVRRLGGG